ncbi:type IVB secretion system protein IcmH/DotU [Legionella sp.]|uniref:type IVB secretion system protein IcmH/DotU n=1 Tax=Legionella sp. TaxID=459 RepID=UPI003CA41ADC
MSAENYPASLVSNLIVDSGALLVPQGYYRSKLFSTPVSTNSLVAAAGPLLSVLERLYLSLSLPPIERFRENIEHELLAFHSKLNASKYPEQTLAIAYYLVSATVDEVLGKNYMRVNHVTAEFKAFTPLTHDNTPPQVRFFEILDYVKERPNQHLDLIELSYFFLIIGFEGQYHLKADGRQVLDNYIEELYQIIQQHRFNKPQRLLNENPLSKVIKKNYKTTLITLAAAAAIVTLAFFTSHLLLDNKAKIILFGHSQFTLLDN